MSTVIDFAGQRRKPVTFTADTLPDAFAIAAILAHDWWDETAMVRNGRLQLVDEHHVPLANPFPQEPKVRFAGQDMMVSAVVAAAAMLVNEPLPAPLRVQMALWNRDDPDNPVLTYADAIEFVEATIDNVQFDQKDRTAPWRTRSAP